MSLGRCYPRVLVYDYQFKLRIGMSIRLLPYRGTAESVGLRDFLKTSKKGLLM
jgi:hypothetical protein